LASQYQVTVCTRDSNLLLPHPVKFTQNSKGHSLQQNTVSNFFKRPWIWRDTGWEPMHWRSRRLTFRRVPLKADCRPFVFNMQQRLLSDGEEIILNKQIYIKNKVLLGEMVGKASSTELSQRILKLSKCW